MELMWVIYLIDTITAGLGGLIAFLIITGLTTLLILGIVCINEEEFVNVWFIKQTAISLLVLSILAVFIPTKDTAYKMLAAYGVTEVYQAASQSEDVQRLAGKSLKMIEKTMDSYLKEAP